MTKANNPIPYSFRKILSAKNTNFPKQRKTL